MLKNPSSTPCAKVPDALLADGWCLVDATTLAALAGTEDALVARWRSHWENLPPDTYLRDGGRYRRRRLGSFVVEAGTVAAVQHRAHWQPVEYNALHGGLERWFEPLPPRLVADPAWAGLLRGLGLVADSMRGHGPGQGRWFVEAHTFRIDTTGGIGRPTPEGAHRDGVDLVAVVLMQRQAIKGGETRVFEADGPRGVRFTLVEPGSALLLDDTRVIHESTPIQPLDAAQPGWRDTLVLTYRAGGFQGPDVPREPGALPP